jgi:NAD(P)-dependent dehydrogenase (short-subunit alcohol dehydrogenase family)
MNIDPIQQFRLDGRVAIVTGAARGIGLSISETLAAAGAAVVMADVDAEALDAVTNSLADRGHQARPEILDVTSEAGIDRVLDVVAKSYGRLDILVNNAGIGARARSTELDRQRWDHVLAINLTGAFLCARAAARIMLSAERGAIVNITSIMGLLGNGIYSNAAYHASKGAVVNLTRALAVEWASSGLRVNSVAPGYVATPLTEKLLSDTRVADAILARTPLGRLVNASDVAAAVLYLVSDAASMVTGQILAVDGGWLAQ